MVVFAFTRDPLIAWGIIFIVGVFSGIFLTLINAMLVTKVPDDMRGRMMSVWGMVWGLIPLTTLVAGSFAEHHGIAIVLAAAGCCVTFTCLWMLATRSPLLDL